MKEFVLVEKNPVLYGENHGFSGIFLKGMIDTGDFVHYNTDKHLNLR